MKRLKKFFREQILKLISLLTKRNKSFAKNEVDPFSNNQIENKTFKPMSNDLNKGIAIIIDEKIHDLQSGDLIHEIAGKVKERGIPFCPFDSLKEAYACLNNFLQINFLILDWQLNVPDGATDQLKDLNAKENIKFIKEFRKTTITPIFILSSLEETDIIEYFEKFGKDIFNNNPIRDFIFIKKKSSVYQNDELFNTVEKWIKSNPALYTLKKWEGAFLSAKNDAFNHLFNISPIWSKILWDTFTFDQVDESTNVNDIIYKNIRSRMSLIEFDKEIIDLVVEEGVNSEEIKSVIIGSNYLAAQNINENDVQPGDIFLIDKKYYINFRPICDTVTARPTCDGIIYCLKGDKLSSGQVKNRYDDNYKMLLEKNNEVLLYGVDGKNFVSFSLKSFESFKYSECKANRIQRLLPPYSNYLQQAVSTYMQRVGLPRTPEVIIQSALPK
jgi:hypothetical protein